MSMAPKTAAAIHVEWGLPGALRAAMHGRVAVIVDTLSFSTCVDIGCSRGAQVLPYGFDNAGAAAHAHRHQALLAGQRSAGGLSLSPASLQGLAAGDRLVLPSPNGSALSTQCSAAVVLAGCLRNASAVTAFAATQGAVTVVAAGERWPDGSLRPAIEDLLAAGAIVARWGGFKTAEALVAEAAFLAAGDRVGDWIRDSLSGRELIERGYRIDVELAVELDSSTCIPRLVDHAFTDVSG